jgi:hypothetical protein
LSYRQPAQRGGVTARFRRWWPPQRFPDPAWYQFRGPVTTVIVVAIIVAGSLTLPSAISRWSCGVANPTADIYSDGGECVGITDGSYSFGSADGQSMTPALSQIAAINNGGIGADSNCPGSRQPATVTIGALVTSTSINDGLRGIYELEGFAAALYEANLGSGGLLQCTYRLRLLVAQMGANEQAAVADAQALAADGVVAVVGLGLSTLQSADAITVLNNDKIPMVADVLTGAGFDQDGSAADNPDFSQCQASDQPGAAPYWLHTWPYFFRVDTRTQVQINEMLNYLKSLPSQRDPKHPQQNYLVKPTTANDAYTCSMVPAIQSGLAARGMSQAQELSFDTSYSAATEDSAATAICGSTGPVTVYYAARAVYLASLLNDIISDRRRDNCRPQSVTVISQSDAAQMRIPAASGSDLANVLSSGDLQDGWLSVYYTPLADPNAISASTPGYKDLTSAFRALDFNTVKLNDGWAIMAYDTVVTVATALRLYAATPPKTVNASVVESQITDQLGTASQNPAPGADGPIRFDNNGNRITAGPLVVRFCASPAGGATSVVVSAGNPGTCP